MNNTNVNNTNQSNENQNNINNGISNVGAVNNSNAPVSTTTNINNNSVQTVNQVTSNVPNNSVVNPNPSTPVTTQNNVELLQEESPTNTTTNTDNSNASNTDNLIADQKLKEVQINYKPPGKFKIFLLALFFIFLLGFVIYLPDINSYVEKYKIKQESFVDEVITTGRLTCSMNRTTNNLDISYQSIFHFTDSKTTRLDFTTSTKGDVDLDEATLDKQQDQCNLLKDMTDDLDGVVISCEYVEGKQTTKQSLTLNAIDKEALNAAYSEAGGMAVEFEEGENIDTVERNMKASGYTCERRKN